MAVVRGSPSETAALTLFRQSTCMAWPSNKTLPSVSEQCAKVAAALELAVQCRHTALFPTCSMGFEAWAELRVAAAASIQVLVWTKALPRLQDRNSLHVPACQLSVQVHMCLFFPSYLDLLC